MFNISVKNKNDKTIELFNLLNEQTQNIEIKIIKGKNVKVRVYDNDIYLVYSQEEHYELYTLFQMKDNKKEIIFNLCFKDERFAFKKNTMISYDNIFKIFKKENKSLKISLLV